MRFDFLSLGGSEKPVTSLLMRSALHAVMLIFVLAPLSGCTVARVAKAWTQSKAGFSPCTADPRILCEPGSAALAQKILPLLPAAIESIERAQYAPFAKPIRIYTYATIQSYATHSGGAEYSAGSASLSTIHLSPKLLQMPERIPAVLIHELSHLHLQQPIGSLAWARIPSWFHEGLATLVSNGGGAETVTAQEALEAFAHGKHFVPEESQWALFPRSASSYDLRPHMYYRQAALFVGYLRESDPEAFRQMLQAIATKVAFAQAVQSSYGKPLQALWHAFLAKQS